MSFDVLAPHYRWMEFLLAGDKLQRSRIAFLHQIPTPRKILLLGEGHGRCLVECRKGFPHARITCLDASNQMLTQARRTLSRSGLNADNVEFLYADILTTPQICPPPDLIVTNFFLDCFRADQLEQIISQLASTAAPKATWLIADFQTAASGCKRIRSRLILWTMFAFFRTVTRLPAKRLTPPDPYLERAGFTLLRRKETEWDLLRSDWWSRTT
jgi:ubiquinone/menaquinone biosynthesis C-methylase UbiE